MRKGTGKELRNDTVSWLETHIFTRTKKLGRSVESILGNQYAETSFFLGAFDSGEVSFKCLVTPLT